MRSEGSAPNPQSFGAYEANTLIEEQALQKISGSEPVDVSLGPGTPDFGLMT